MRAIRRTLCVGLGILSINACSPARELPPRPPPARVVPALVIPHPARWALAYPFFASEHPLGVGEETMLHAGDMGRRLLLRPDGFSEATHLGTEPFIAARSIGKAFRFYGELGAILESDTPLSNFTKISPGSLPVDPRPEVAVGTRNAIAIQEGTIFRSLDGAPFQVIAKEKLGIPAWQTPLHVAMTIQGRGYLATAPAGVFLTKDDGVTWERSHPPRHGIAGLFATEYGDLCARSILRPGEVMSLAGDEARPAPPPLHVEIGAHPADRSTAFIGDRVLRYDDHQLEVVRADGTRTVTALKSRIDALGGDGDELYMLADHQLFHSADGGAHFTGDQLWPYEYVAERMRIAVDGAAVVVAACDASCSSVLARAAPGALHGVSPSDDGATILDVTMNAGRVFVLAAVNAHVRLYAGPPTATKLERFGTLDLPLAEPIGGLDLTVDEHGLVRALVRSGTQTLLLRVDAMGGPRAPHTLALELHYASLAGDRGLASVQSLDYLVETDDGGEHWTRVGGAVGSIACSKLGCSVWTRGRFGWDLPAPPDVPRYTPAPKVAPPPKTIACTPKGAPEKLGEAASVFPIATSSGLALIVVESRMADTFRVVGKGKAEPLLPKLKPAKNGALVKGVSVDSDESGRAAIAKVDAIPGGLLAMRSHFFTAKKLETLTPVEVELAWWSSTTGKLHRATLGPLAPFRVGATSGDLDGEGVVLADDVLIFHPKDAPTAFRVTPDGKAKLLPFPNNTKLAGVAESGSLIRFHGVTSAGDVVGVLEKHAILHAFGWAFGAESPRLVSLSSVPYLATPRALFSLEDLSTSAPDPILRGAERPWCGTPVSLLTFVKERDDTTELTIAGGKTLRLSSVTTALNAKGAGCLVARQFSQGGFSTVVRDTAFVTKGSAFGFRDHQLQPLTCTE